MYTQITRPAYLCKVVLLYLIVNTATLGRTLSFLLCLVLATGYGQPGQQNIFHHLGLREGLLSDEVNAIVQDTTGYTWIAGKDGLQRYDGYRFLDFKHRDGDSGSLPDNNILSLKVDGNNRLWLLSANQQLGYFDTRKFVYRKVKVSLHGNTLERVSGELQLDPQKNILLLVKSTENMINGVAGYDEKRNIFSDDDKRFERPQGWQLLSFSFDSTAAHHLWMCTNQGLVKYDTRLGISNWRGHNGGSDPVIAALQDYRMVQNPLLDMQGNFWMTASDKEAKNSHLLKYTITTNKLTDYYTTIDAALHHAFYKITSIVQPDSGAVWITGRSIFIKAGTGLDFIPNNLPGEFSIHYDFIKQVSTDREKNAWISTNRGVYYINTKPSPFMFVPSSTDVVDFVQTPDHHILVATWGNGLLAYDSLLRPVQSEITAQSQAEGEKLVWAVHKCTNGDIWRTGQDGWLYIYHASTHRTEKLHDAIFDNKTIRQVAEDGNGNLWFSTQGNSLIRWSRKDDQFRIMKTTDRPVFRLYADRGGIWAIAGAAMKINIDDGSVLTQYNTGPADGKHLLAGDLTDILRYSDSIYIISGRGINIVNTQSKHISYFTAEKGLPSDYVSNIITDKNGELWIATENGLCNLSFKKQELHIYNFEDGIYNSAFTPVSSTRLADGRIALGTNQDWMIFDPADIHGGDRFPGSNIAITGIAVMNKRMNADSLLSLPAVQLDYAANAITIQFSALVYSSRYTLAYMMEGLDKQPINAGAHTEAVYSYLPPGRYIFKVGVRDANGNITHFSSFPIAVHAPFWRDWPFYALLLLVAGLITWWMDKQRLNRIRQVLHMRNSIGRDLHAEVSTALEKISILSELADIKAASQPELSKDYIRDIKVKSRSTLTAMEDVMWSIDPANDTMAVTINKMHELADAAEHEFGAQIRIRAEAGVTNYSLSMKERLEFLLIYKKSILLLAGQLRAGHIAVTLQSSSKELVMIISSGDVSFSTEQNFATSIADIKKRAEALPCLLDVGQHAGVITITAVIQH